CWWTACGLFWLAVASDVLDGRLARARNETSTFGGFFDHASDATFVFLGHLALAKIQATPDLLPIFIMLAFLQYALDSRILDGQALRVSIVGRWNGVCYFIAPGALVTREALGWTLPPNAWIAAIGWLLLATTLLSMADRLFAVFARQK
ncbi:MAG: CDP-alcohol phosphatidyltransferase family protein, partial [Myxococcota bacterium]